ncbi:hypothetical protein HMPREF1869_00703 [Bacteroidales bacterium KA00251]|nr:hypothetical protein HMPREF1869_00703 [Bacteroidales bacterium KA00251]
MIRLYATVSSIVVVNLRKRTPPLGFTNHTNSAFNNNLLYRDYL